MSTVNTAVSQSPEMNQLSFRLCSEGIHGERRERLNRRRRAPAERQSSDTRLFGCMREIVLCKSVRLLYCTHERISGSADQRPGRSTARRIKLHSMPYASSHLLAQACTLCATASFFAPATGLPRYVSIRRPQPLLIAFRCVCTSFARAELNPFRPPWASIFSLRSSPRTRGASRA